jgi:segregation and condensation protein A
MLLPDYKQDGEEEDPRIEITRPLLEYMHLKSAAEELAEREILHRDVFTRPQDKTLREQVQSEGPEVDANIFQLITAFKQIIETQQMETRLKIESPRWSVKEKTTYILEVLRARKIMYFGEIFRGQTILSELVVTFLALLELVRAGLVRVYQAAENTDIKLEAKFEDQGETNE